MAIDPNIYWQHLAALPKNEYTGMLDAFNQNYNQALQRKEMERQALIQKAQEDRAAEQHAELMSQYARQKEQEDRLRQGMQFVAQDFAQGQQNYGPTQDGGNLMPTGGYQDVITQGLQSGVYDSPEKLQALGSYATLLDKVQKDSSLKDGGWHGQGNSVWRYNPETGSIEWQTAPQKGKENTDYPDNQYGLAVLAAQGDTVAARALEVAGNKKAPTDMRPDGKGGFEVIPNSKLDKTNKKAYAKQKSALKSVTQSLENLERKVTQLKQHPGTERIFGVMGAFPNIPGGDASDAEAIKNSIIAQLGIKTLSDMRAASPTGGAVGQVSEKEWPILQSAITSLEKAQSYEQALMAADEILNSIARSKKDMQEGFDSEYEGTPYSQQTQQQDNTVNSTDLQRAAQEELERRRNAQ